MAARIFLVTLMLLAPLTAQAAFLDYQVDEGNSKFLANVDASVTVTYVLPAPSGSSATLTPTGVADIPLSGSVAVDTGLPGNFDGGANGIQLKNLDLHATAAPGESLASFTDSGSLSPIGYPISLTASLTAVSVVFAPTVSTSDSLTSSGLVDEYLWGPVSVATVVTLHGSLLAEVSANGPTLPVQIWNSDTDGPLVGAAEVPWSGHFSGENNGTVVTLTADVDDLPPFSDVGGVGYFTWDVSLTISQIEAGALATNPTTLPEPSAGTLGAVAFLTVGLLSEFRRRRK